MRFQLILILILVSSICIGQNQANWWCFGDKSGLNFNLGNPQYVNANQMSTKEGCSSISDFAGDLLFYSDGRTVWNSSHVVMPNGSGLTGGIHPTQTGLIIPVPGNSDMYYIFSVDEGNGGNSGIHYSMVDMTLNGANGDVISTTKNTLLFKPSYEKITAAPLVGECGYWLIAQQYRSNIINAFKITSSGISNTPVTSNIGLTSQPAAGIGYMKTNPQGNRLAAVYTYLWGGNNVILMDFNGATGVLSNRKSDNVLNPYGVEFSGNGTKLYVSSRDEINGPIFQYDATSQTELDFKSSRFSIASGQKAIFSAMQLGPNHKIYVLNSTGMAVINNPNAKDGKCSFNANSISFNSTKLNEGLPTFLPSLLYQSSVNALNACIYDSVYMQVHSCLADSIRFNFGDSTNGIGPSFYSNVSSHKYSKPGHYQIRVTVFSSLGVNVIRTIHKDSILIKESPNVDLGDDIEFCGLDKIVLYDVVNTKKADWIYRWFDGTKKDTCIISDAGKKWVTVLNSCGVDSDTIRLTAHFPLNVNLGSDTVICEGINLQLSPNIDAAEIADYQWNNGLKVSEIDVEQPGEYWVKIRNMCGVYSDTIGVDLIFRPKINLGNDTIICSDDILLLSPSISEDQQVETKIVWQGKIESKFFKVKRQGLYRIEASNFCGSTKDTVHVTQQEKIGGGLFPDTVVCKSQLVYDLNILPYAIEWQDGSTKKRYTIDSKGDYSFTMTDEVGCTGFEHFSVEECSGDLYAPAAFTPNRNAVNEGFRVYKTEIYDFELVILNQWNQVVFQSNDITEEWYGTNQKSGTDCPIGTYVWKVNFKEIQNNQEQIVIGEVNIIR